MAAPNPRSRPKGPPPSSDPDRGDEHIREAGYSYLPKFITAAEGAALVSYFASLHPIWENRYADKRRRGGSGRLTRPVYWLGAWQFAALGYYAEPNHLENRCVRAEPLPTVMTDILERLRPELGLHGEDALPNTCLINYYGRVGKSEGKPPVDYARLRMHRDAEPGAVVMFSVGQPAQFEFVLPDATEPKHSQWVRNRSVVILSGPEYKDTLYHRVTRVRYGQDPVLTSKLEAFEVRRISVSFRHVPDAYIHDLADLSEDARAIATPYVEQLAAHSAHFQRQLEG
ncbi:MAG: alpha-ketoglutarate-dependent dioxygenase AlkB [Proteobacteria bacterium]|nr:alpha-ketoglutarate-dependent dioxygenase AlkB [Pseudomonadota bacterium]